MTELTLSLTLTRIPNLVPTSTLPLPQPLALNPLTPDP